MAQLFGLAVALAEYGHLGHVDLALQLLLEHIRIGMCGRHFGRRRSSCHRAVPPLAAALGKRVPGESALAIAIARALERVVVVAPVELAYEVNGANAVVDHDDERQPEGHHRGVGDEAARREVAREALRRVLALLVDVDVREGEEDKGQRDDHEREQPAERDEHTDASLHVVAELDGLGDAQIALERYRAQVEYGRGGELHVAAQPEEAHGVAEAPVGEVQLRVERERHDEYGEEQVGDGQAEHDARRVVRVEALLEQDEADEEQVAREHERLDDEEHAPVQVAQAHNVMQQEERVAGHAGRRRHVADDHGRQCHTTTTTTKHNKQQQHDSLIAPHRANIVCV